jgi:predicted alpha/beta-fold hydrolase
MTGRLDMSACPVPAWLPGGHAQTIYPALWAPRPSMVWNRERLETPDGDFVDLDWSHGTANKGVLILFHGLEGSSRSHYAGSIGHYFVQRGWQVVMPHFRGCSGEPNRRVRAYHSGDAQEIGWLIEQITQRPSHGPRVAVGISLGGNALLRWLGEQGQSVCHVAAAAAVSAPLDLAAGGAALERGFNRVYTRNFLTTLKPKTLEKARRFPGAFNVQAIRRARNLREFDDAYTAPIHGYRDAADYWARASSKPLLHRIAIPTLVLNARNDPFLPAQHLPSVQEVSQAVTLHQPAQGGHVGFLTGRWPGTLEWLPQRLERHLREAGVHG